MNCPYCGNEESKVIDSRDANEGIRRRRQCLQCGSRFTTYERVQVTSLFVIKKDKRREEFNKNKLVMGIRKACEKRPLPADTPDILADDIEAELIKQNRMEITSKDIGDMVMQRLKIIDQIAYIRFASIYREFADITMLKEEVDNLANDKKKTKKSTAQLSLLPSEELERVTQRQKRSRK